MRHKYGNRKLSKPTDQRLAMLNSLSVALFKYKKIQTTVPRAKQLKRYTDNIIRMIKKNDLTSRRRVTALLLHDKVLTKSLFDNVKNFDGRNSGYSRIIRTEMRRGDAAPMALVELV